MTEQAKEFKRYRDKGYTFQQIADKFGCSRQRVAYVIESTFGCSFRPFTEERCVYPGLMRWLNCNHINIRNLCVILYGSAVGGTTLCGVRHRLRGDVEWNQWQINKILDVSHMTYEEVFREGRYE